MGEATVEAVEVIFEWAFSEPSGLFKGRMSRPREPEVAETIAPLVTVSEFNSASKPPIERMPPSTTTGCNAPELFTPLSTVPNTFIENVVAVPPLVTFNVPWPPGRPPSFNPVRVNVVPVPLTVMFPAKVLLPEVARS